MGAGSGTGGSRPRECWQRLSRTLVLFWHGGSELLPQEPRGRLLPPVKSAVGAGRGTGSSRPRESWQRLSGALRVFFYQRGEMAATPRHFFCCFHFVFRGTLHALVARTTSLGEGKRFCFHFVFRGTMHALVARTTSLGENLEGQRNSIYGLGTVVRCFEFILVSWHSACFGSTDKPGRESTGNSATQPTALEQRKASSRKTKHSTLN